MARYLVNAPDGVSVTIGSGYGTITLNHGQEVSNSKLAVMFPHLFVQIQGDEPEIQVQPADETLSAKISEEMEIAEEVPVTTPENTPPEDKAVFFVDVGEISDEAALEIAKEVAEKLGAAEPQAEVPTEVLAEVQIEVPAEAPVEKPKGRKNKEK